jgi:hypothetical protein
MADQKKTLWCSYQPRQGVCINGTYDVLDYEKIDYCVHVCWMDCEIGEFRKPADISSFQIWADGPAIMVDGKTCCIRLVFLNKIELALFLKRYLCEIIDIFAALIRFSDQTEDFLWITPAEQGRVWVFALLRQGSADHWYGQVVLANSMENWLTPFGPFDSFITTNRDSAIIGMRDSQLLAETVEQLNESATDLLNHLGCDGMGLPTDFPFLAEPEEPVKNLGMVIKLHPECLWFLCFPMDYFTFMPGVPGCFGRKRPEWIATAKPLSVHLDQKTSILKGLDAESGILIILNDNYPHFFDEGIKIDSPQLIKRGAEVIRKIMGCCAADCCGDEQIVLDVPYPGLFSWTCNPSHQKLSDLLVDKRFKYVFADFHTKCGKWCLTEDVNDLFDVSKEFTEGQLSHLRLMRIFHCQSLKGRKDLGMGATLVQGLLRAGAWRVEGSFLKEDVLQFMIFLLNILTKELAMQVSLNCMVKLGPTEAGRLYDEANSFLRDLEYQTN